jgi:hypothetical protein
MDECHLQGGAVATIIDVVAAAIVEGKHLENDCRLRLSYD